MKRFIEKLSADRRLSQRHILKAGFRVRIRRSDVAERRAESENFVAARSVLRHRFAIEQGCVA
jgi:hypothetical protein